MKIETSLRGKIHGIKGVFLAEGTTILHTDIESNEDTIFSCWPIRMLLDVIREKKKNINCIYVDGNDRFFIFVNGKYILGVVTSPNVNLPLLRILAKKTLENVGTQEDQTEEAKVSKRILPEDQVIVSALSAEELSELPEMVRSLLELVNGERTLKEIVRISSLPPEQVVEFIHNYRRTGKLLGIEKGFDKESVCRKLRSQGL